jgi:hypothetical protein
MIPRVVVFYGPDHDLIHTSLLMTGFCALRRRGAIDLRYRWPRREEDRWLAGDPIVVCFDVTAPVSRRVAIDLRDGEGVSWPIIDRVDVYLKRAFYPPELGGLPPALARKVAPYGLNFGARSAESTLRLLRAIGVPLLRRGPTGLQRLRQFLSTPAIAAFEQAPDAAVEHKVAFQTRLWTREEIPPEEVEPLNIGRVEMVRALRRAFGNRFVGGLVPTPFACARYPDEITPHPSRYAAYLALKKRCLVSVYTRGVEHSLAFKLGETLAASQCLVSMPLRYELPAPLVEGRNYLPFGTPEEAITACHRLLDNPILAQEMRRANHDYYVHEVEPAAHTERVIRDITRI